MLLDFISEIEHIVAAGFNEFSSDTVEVQIRIHDPKWLQEKRGTGVFGVHIRVYPKRELSSIVDLGLGPLDPEVDNGIDVVCKPLSHPPF